jgi:dolichyl-phosphate beta-glucosyltransferase
MKKTLTIIIPAFNEENRILKNLNEINDYVAKNSLFDEIKTIVIDDGSTDKTKEAVEEWIKSKLVNGFSIVSYKPNKGKGYAVRDGFLKADSELILYTDADGASPISEIEKLLPEIDKGFTVVCGSRVLKNESVSVKMALKRRVIGLVFHMLLGLLKLNFIKDTQCGFKLFEANVAKKIAKAQKCFNFSFDIEYLYLSRKMGCKINEVPINWYHVKGSKVNLVIDSIKMLVEVLKIRFYYKYNT